MEENDESMSDDSFEISDTAMLVRQRNTTTKPTQNGHTTLEATGDFSPKHNGHAAPISPVTISKITVNGLENGDSGIESIANGDSQESLGTDGASHQQLIQITE